MTRAAVPRTLSYFETPQGQQPFKDWFDGLEVSKQLRIDARLARLEAGNLGDHKGVGQGVKELKFKDGTRIYIGEQGAEVVLLLIGGDKSTQRRDIKTAKDFWTHFKLRRKHETKI